jgi:hypothetical protein
MSDQEQPKMDVNNLYREETFTDQTVGTIRTLVPVTSTGENDSARETLFLGAAQMMTPAGALPLNFEIEAANLAEACEKFADFAQEAMEKTFKELQEMRREQASSIVVPGQGSPGGGIQVP